MAEKHGRREFMQKDGMNSSFGFIGFGAWVSLAKLFVLGMVCGIHLSGICYNGRNGTHITSIPGEPDRRE